MYNRDYGCQWLLFCVFYLWCKAHVFCIELQKQDFDKVFLKFFFGEVKVAKWK